MFSRKGNYMKLVLPIYFVFVNIKALLHIYFIFIIAVFVGTVKDFKDMVSTPKELTEIHSFNMLAAIILYIICVILNPLLFIVKFFYWVFHLDLSKKTSRKENKK